MTNKLTVIVNRRPNLRDSYVEMTMFIGRSILDNIFEKFVVSDSTAPITLSYPETFCNIIELRALVGRLSHYYPKAESYTIITHSVYIIQTVNRENIRIVQNEQVSECSFDDQDFYTKKLYSKDFRHIIDAKLCTLEADND